MKKLKDYQESLERYKIFYPENCINKTDIEILLFRKLITKENALEMAGIVFRPSDKSVRKERIKKSKIISEKQFKKLMKEFNEGAQESIIDLNYNRPEGEGLSIEDIAYDLADSFLFSHPEIHNYLNHQKVELAFHKEYIADYAV
ncbi:MAG: hypothetical protein ABIC57_01430 [bacterium]